MLSFEDAYKMQFKIWEEAEADLWSVLQFLIQIEKDTPDKRIAEFLTKRGIKL